MNTSSPVTSSPEMEFHAGWFQRVYWVTLVLTRMVMIRLPIRNVKIKKTPCRIYFDSFDRCIVSGGTLSAKVERSSRKVAVGVA